jgi:hypothetical protein
MVKYGTFSRKHGQMPIAIGFTVEYVACGGGRIQSANTIRGAADNMSQLQRTRSSENCVPAQKAGASGKQTGNHGIMGRSGSEVAHFRHHDNSG